MQSAACPAVPPQGTSLRVLGIIAEINKIKCIMERNSRFSPGTKSPLKDELRSVKTYLMRTTGAYRFLFSPSPHSPVEIEPLTVLQPFLSIILSDQTTGPITAAALASVQQIVSAHFLNHSPRDVNAVIYAAVHCRFEETHALNDEIVYWRMVELLSAMATTPWTRTLLSNERLWDTLKSLYEIAFMAKASVLVRDCGKRALRNVVMTLFERAPALLASVGERGAQCSSAPPPGAAGEPEWTVVGTAEEPLALAPVSSPSSPSPGPAGPASGPGPSCFVNSQGILFRADEDEPAGGPPAPDPRPGRPAHKHRDGRVPAYRALTAANLRPYDANMLLRVYGFLCDIADPNPGADNRFLDQLYTASLYDPPAPPPAPLDDPPATEASEGAPPAGCPHQCTCGAHDHPPTPAAAPGGAVAAPAGSPVGSPSTPPAPAASAAAAGSPAVPAPAPAPASASPAPASPAPASPAPASPAPASPAPAASSPAPAVTPGGETEAPKAGPAPPAEDPGERRPDGRRAGHAAPHPAFGALLEETARLILVNTRTADPSLLSSALHLLHTAAAVYLRLIQADIRPELREVTLEALLAICNDPGIVLELYSVYDLSPYHRDIFEELCKELSKARPSSPIPTPWGDARLPPPYPAPSPTTPS
ncbi:hypothetical protein PAPYR_9780 [Paratrimastix pyriformis]|uniref:Uncharacterized protein n=1 Tax=Paratrimastix pyriformis TaxID=342808 RepID=A0ABQ8UCD9_9EUKA|nr:hypothetical protein PAPYR_9780 [Paratrimastix pyriformis]